MTRKLECETCEQHDDVVRDLESVKNRFKFWSWVKKWWFLHVIVLMLLAGMFGWGKWVTTSIYARDTREAAEQQAMKEVAKDVEEIKKDMKEQAKKQEADQKDIYNLLLDIKKQTKKP